MNRVGVIGAILILGVVGAAAWLAIRPLIPPVVVPGATNVHIDHLGLWEQQISYEVRGRPFAWYWTVARQLEAQQWKVNRGWHPELAPPSYNPLIPLIFERISLGFLVEEVVLNPDSDHPNVAHIRVTRRAGIADFVVMLSRRACSMAHWTNEHPGVVG